MDTDNSGTITLEELKQGLANQGTKLSVFEAKQLMEAVSSLKLYCNVFDALFFATILKVLN